MYKMLLKENRVHGDVSFPLNSYYMSIPPGGNVLDCHWHEELEFLTVTSGCALFQIETDYFEVHAGECIFVNTSELHAGFCTGTFPCEYRAVVFSPSLLFDSSFDLVRTRYIDPVTKNQITVKRHIKGAEAWERELLSRLKNLLELLNSRPYTYELLVKSELFAMFALLTANCMSAAASTEKRQNHLRLEKLKAALKFIEENYTKKLSTLDISMHLNMSEGHFCRIFKDFVKKTPLEYLNCYRIHQAARLLEETDMKVLEVAMEVGFDNLSYFIETFKRHVGMTPSRYRCSRR